MGAPTQFTEIRVNIDGLDTPAISRTLYLFWTIG
jgi:hypothetical protein